MPKFQIGELVRISNLSYYNNPEDLDALIIDCVKSIDEVDGGETYDYELITENLGYELVISERFLERI